MILINRVKPHPSFSGPVESGICKMAVIGLGKQKGAGMDTMIISRYTHDGVPKDKRQQTICVLDLTDETQGNANGMGLADVVPRRFAQKIDFLNTYPNNLTSRVLGSSEMPLVMDHDKAAIQAAIHACTGIDYKRPKLIWIKNTLDVARIVISEALFDEWNQHREQYPHVEPAGSWFSMEFDPEGNLKRLDDRR